MRSTEVLISMVDTDPTEHDADERTRIELEDAHPDFDFGPEAVEYPAELRITSLSKADARAAARERLRRWEAGEEVPHVKNFQDPAAVRKLLTPRRIELLESIMHDPPASIRALSGRLERGPKQVHDDVHLLANYGIVHFESGDGRARKPRVPYDSVRIDIEIASTSRADDIAPA